MAGFEDLWFADYWVRVTVAVACAAAIGLERQLRGKPAGIRTSILIGLGSCLFVWLGAGELAGAEDGDSTRVLGQIVTGIGFLGAGLILTRGPMVSGVTSAAVVWLLAAVGAAAGLGRYGIAVGATGVSLVILIGVQALERVLPALRSGIHGDDQHE